MLLLGSIWLGFPERGATDLGIFHPNILGVKYPSQVYLESHRVNHINLMLSDDPVVKEAVNCQLEREGAWKKKSSTAAKCQTIFNQISQTTAIPFKESCPNVHTRRLQTKKVKAVGKNLTSEIFAEQANAKADELKSQGALACLLLRRRGISRGRASSLPSPRGSWPGRPEPPLTAWQAPTTHSESDSLGGGERKETRKKYGSTILCTWGELSTA